MNDPVSITRDGHRTFFKWHRARRRAGDPVFTGRRILEGMALGASVEVDLVVHGSSGFAVLHDHLALERETTGSGPARSMTGERLRALQLRGNDGAPIADKVMLLEDLCALLVETPPHPDALLQLDYKEDIEALSPQTIASFVRCVGPVARNMIVSGGDAAAIRMLTAAVPDLASGYDPSDQLDETTVRDLDRLRRFVDDAIAAAPEVEMIYLYWEIVTIAAEVGFDIVDAFHRAGRRIDAWTITVADAGTLLAVERLLACKVDQITTDDPEGLIALIEAKT